MGPTLVTRAVWCTVALLTAIGVASAIGRSVFPADLTTRAEPFRQSVVHWLDRRDPPSVDRAALARRVDDRFADHPRLTLLHVVPGGIFLLFAPLQFVRSIRTRHLRLHRWSGRVLLAAGAASVLPAFFFGVGMPFGGLGEATAIAVFGAWFLVALVWAFVAIRRKQMSIHREWMLRAFATALSISTVRVVAAVYDLTLSPAGYSPEAVFVLSLWSGWALTLGGAEWWIRHSRPRFA